jgi:hypothetical protein
VRVALCIQHTKRILRIELLPVVCIVLLPAVCPTLQYFSALFYRRHDFQEKAIGCEICVLIFSSNMSEEFFFLRRSVRDININVDMLKIPLQFSDFKVL